MDDVWGHYADLDFKIGQTGKRGGYAFTFRVDGFDAVWFAKKPKANDPWGLFVSIGSRQLALHGLSKSREQFGTLCDTLGFRIPPNGISINRIDFAVDMLAPGFVLDPNSFVFHSRANRKAISDVEMVEMNGRSGRTTSVTIGKMPCRQVIVYDKREEVLKKRKHEWPLIWNANLEAAGLPCLDLADREASQVWRVELRLGKDALRKRHDIRGWGSLHEHLQAEMDQLVEDVSLRVPCGDNNRSRWPVHTHWRVAQKAVKTRLFEHEARVPPEAVREVDLAEKKREILNLIASMCITLAFLEGRTPKTFSNFLSGLQVKIMRFLREHPRRVEARFTEAEKKYRSYMAR